MKLCSEQTQRDTLLVIRTDVFGSGSAKEEVDEKGGQKKEKSHCNLGWFHPRLLHLISVR